MGTTSQSNDFALLKKAELPRSKFLSSGQISKESTNDAYVVQPGGPSAEILSPKQTEKELSDLGLWRGRNGSEDGATSGPDITIISFASYGVLDFALNWLYFVNDAIGPEELKDRLLMYVADESTKKVLLASGLIQEACIRYKLQLRAADACAFYHGILCTPKQMNGQADARNTNKRLPPSPR